MLILQGWLVSTSSPSHTFLLKLSWPSADRGNGITVVSLYCCCLSKGAYIESNFPLKVANCSQKIVTAIACRWLAASFGAGSEGWKDFICRRGGERKKKGAVHIERCVVKNECEVSHAPDDENGCFFARLRRNKILCICWHAKRQKQYAVSLTYCSQRGYNKSKISQRSCFYYKPCWGCIRKEKSVSVHVLQLCKDQEDLFLLAACLSPNTKKSKYTKGAFSLCWGQMSSVKSCLQTRLIFYFILQSLYQFIKTVL